MYRCSELGSGLGLVYATLLLEHNRLVSQLARTNPHWGSDTLYLEARRIVIAQLQHITFSEFLPSLLGEVSEQIMTMEVIGSLN